MAMTSLTQRRPRILALCAAVGVCALLAAGCGSSAAPGSGTSSAGTSTSGSSSAGTASAAKVSLDVSFSGSAGTAPAHYTLRCEPAGGTVRDAAAACAKLMKHGASLFGPLPVHVACPMILASAGRATVRGTYLGQRVHESVVDGGCDLSRWGELRQIFS
jgi:Subtilisin inhibitor-like